jgi:hypothetical protein
MSTVPAGPAAPEGSRLRNAWARGCCLPGASSTLSGYAAPFLNGLHTQRTPCL